MSKSADAQPDYSVMTYVIKTRVDQITIAETSDNECVSLALAAPAFCPRNLYANQGGNGIIDGNLLALFWTATD